MGIVISRLGRSAKRFNVEARTEKVLAREKPEPAPRHPTTQAYPVDPLLDAMIATPKPFDCLSFHSMREDGHSIFCRNEDKPKSSRLVHQKTDDQIKEEISNKNVKLDGFLKSVYVTSQGSCTPVKPKHGKPSDRDRLPQYRGIVEESDFGFAQLDNVPEGKVSLPQVMKLLADYQADPKKNDAEDVALKYKINITNAENILKYFGSLKVHIFEPKEELKLSHSVKKKIGNPMVLEIPKPQEKE